MLLLREWDTPPPEGAEPADDLPLPLGIWLPIGNTYQQVYGKPLGVNSLGGNTESVGRGGPAVAWGGASGNGFRSGNYDVQARRTWAAMCTFEAGSGGANQTFMGLGGVIQIRLDTSNRVEVGIEGIMSLGTSTSTNWSTGLHTVAVHSREGGIVTVIGDGRILFTYTSGSNGYDITATGFVTLGKRQGSSEMWAAGGRTYAAAVWDQEIPDIQHLLARTADPYRTPHSLFQARHILLVKPASGNATAPGATVAVTASVIAGAATAASAASGATITVTSSVLAGAASAGGLAPGASLVVTASLIAGAANASSAAPGTTQTVTASEIAGAATASSAAPGTTRTVAVSTIAGAAQASSSAAGTTQVITTSVLPGAASGASAGTAPGATITVQASVLSGAAVASSAAPGTTRTIVVSMLPGAASGSASATAPGATLVIVASILPGGAYGLVIYIPSPILFRSPSRAAPMSSAARAVSGVSPDRTTSFTSPARAN